MLGEFQCAPRSILQRDWVEGSSVLGDVNGSRLVLKRIDDAVDRRLETLGHRELRRRRLVG